LEQAVKNIHEELIERCKVNDRKAQFDLYKLYYKSMYNTALRILNDSAEAEDVMQEAFLDAFRKIDSYRKEASFGSWLKRIVINRSLDAIKRKKDLTSIDDMNGELPSEVKDEDYLEILTEKISAIREGIHMLPDNYRIVMSLYLLEGYDQGRSNAE